MSSDRAAAELVPDGKREAGMPRLPMVPPGPRVERRLERAFIQTWIESKQVPALTIVGPGGVGKTHLALTVAHDMQRHFRDGVYFISFEQLAPDAIWEAAARVLGITNAAHAPWPVAVRDALCTRELLLVLDNCETVIDGFAELPAILGACPGVMVLATSQEALRIRGEQELWLDPLELPAESAHYTVDTLRQSTAVELFSMRAASASPGFAITDENARDLAAIVRKLDGLPLAIELAAAQMRHLTTTGLLKRLDAALPSLGGGPRDLPDRHKSLLSAVEWSLDLLSPEDRAAFLQLAVFAGDFTPDAAIAVVDGTSAHDGWELLLSFADKSLLKRVSDDDEAQPRFLMLKTVRAVAQNLLRHEAELHRGARSRHARYVVDLVREADRNYHGPDQLMWLRRIDAEHGNIRVVMENGLLDDHDVQPALEIAGPNFWYWYTRGFHTWALPLIERLLARAPKGLPADIAGAAHVTAGWLAFKQAQVDRAELHFTTASRLLPQAASRAALLGRIGGAYVLSFDRRDTPAAIAQLRAVTELAQDVDGAWHERAAGFFGVGLLEYFDRHVEPARTSFEASIRIARAHDDPQSIGMNLVYLAHIDRVTGDPRAALGKLQEALPLLVEIGDQATIALTLDVVISTLVDLDELALARTIVAVGDHLRRTAGIPRPPLEQPDFTDALARIHAVLGEDAEPERHRVPLSEAITSLLQFRASAPGTPQTQHGDQQQATADAPAVPATSVLSPRELEVLQLIASGLTSAEIATSLFVSRHTVKRHMANIRAKLGVRSQAAAVAALQRDDQPA